MAFTYVTITETYETAGDVAAHGTVEFTPVAEMHNGISIVAAAEVATLDVAGSISKRLAATTDPATWPVGVTYKVVEKIVGQPALTYFKAIPHDQGPTLQLSLLPPVAGGSTGGFALRSALDYDNAVAPTDGQVMTWDGTTSKFHPEAAPAAAVTSVNGDTGAVSVTASSIGAQPVDTDLTAVAALTPANDDIVQRKAGVWTNRTIAQVKTDLAVNNVDNTSDANKPVSTAQQTALNLKLDTSAASETIDDRVAALIVAGSNITKTYDDTANTLTIAATSTVGYGTVQDEGSGLTARGTINFVGAGVTATDDAGNTRTLVTIPGGGSGYNAVAEEGSSLTARATLNFIGRAVTAVDNAGSTRTDVTVADLPSVHAVGNSGTTLTIDASSTAGPVKTITLNNNCTFTLSGAVSGQASYLELVLTQDGTGGRVVTWPASVKWAGGAPTLSTAASATDRIVLTTYNAGTTWYGDLVGKAYA